MTCRDQGGKIVAPSSEADCSVTVAVSSGADEMCVRLIGDVEIGAEAALQVAIDRVRQVAPRTVIVDLAEVGFAGSVFAHFVDNVHHAAPRASIAVCRPSPMAKFVLAVTGVDRHLSPPGMPIPPM